MDKDETIEGDGPEVEDLLCGERVSDDSQDGDGEDGVGADGRVSRGRRRDRKSRSTGHLLSDSCCCVVCNGPKKESVIARGIICRIPEFLLFSFVDDLIVLCLNSFLLKLLFRNHRLV